MSCVTAWRGGHQASAQLLTTCPGSACNGRQHRGLSRENGPFGSRAQLLKVPRLGPKASNRRPVSSASATPPTLGRQRVHPERYKLVETMARDVHCTVPDLLRDPSLRGGIDLSRTSLQRWASPP